MHVLRSVTEPTLEETAKAGDFPKTFQLYVRGDWDWTKDILTRVKNAGYAALCVTVDTAHLSHRERPMLGRYAPPTQQASAAARARFQAASTWDTMERIRDFAGLPFMLKGIATAEDAAICVQKGIDVVWVSNHGGRRLDHNRGAIETLPEIYAVTKGKAKIILDGGIQRGTDVIKALPSARTPWPLASCRAGPWARTAPTGWCDCWRSWKARWRSPWACSASRLWTSSTSPTSAPPIPSCSPRDELVH